MIIDPLLSARRVYEPIYKTQTPLDYLGVPFLSSKRSLNQKKKAAPPPVTERLPTSAFNFPMPHSASSALSHSPPMTILMFSSEAGFRPLPSQVEL